MAATPEGLDAPPGGGTPAGRSGTDAGTTTLGGGDTDAPPLQRRPMGARLRSGPLLVVQIFTCRVIWPLFSQNVTRLARYASSGTGWRLPSTSKARERMVWTPAAGRF